MKLNYLSSFLFLSFISCDLLNIKDQEGSNGFFDKVNAILDASEEAIHKFVNGENDSPQKNPINQSSKSAKKVLVIKPRTKRTLNSQDDHQSLNYLHDNYHPNNIDDISNTIPEISDNTNTIHGTSDSMIDSITDKNSTYPISGTSNSLLKDEEGQTEFYSNNLDLEFTFDSYPALSGSYHDPMTQVDDNYQYEEKSFLENTIKLINKIYQDYEQVYIHTTIANSSMNLGETEKKANSRNKLSKYSKEQLKSDLENLVAKLEKCNGNNGIRLMYNSYDSKMQQDINTQINTVKSWISELQTKNYNLFQAYNLNMKTTFENITNILVQLKNKVKNSIDQHESEIKKDIQNKKNNLNK
ncbi:hypothetical protein [Borrelia hispanica]|uniref:hypothetical protein n=1 Tax=Borrelia hispanica TaxID=40835 RepID=UPI00046303E1|nr:hypothetical protein [Borrelia hispanica]